MTALLALIPLRDWLWAALVVLLISAGVYEVHHERQLGAAHEVAALDASTKKLQAQTAVQTADLKAKATMAEQAYDKEQSESVNYRATHPEQPVRLCLDAAHSGSVVPAAGSKVTRNESASTGTVSVQQVPSGDSSDRTGRPGPDIAGMLSLLAQRGDEVSAVLREYQSR